MSRAFLKNESADDPVVIPARAPLPPGATNYVTPRGLALLHTEHEALEAERAQAHDEPDENERTRLLALLNGRLANLNQRIASARLIDPHEQPHDVVRFGATVRVRRQRGKATPTERQFRLVGVDEADADHGLIAFTAPLARLLVGRRVGETTVLRTAQGDEQLTVLGIDYPA